MKDIVFILLVILIASCQPQEDSLRSYFKDPPTSINSEIIEIEAAFFGNPRRIVLFDSLIIIEDDFHGKLFSLIDIKNGKFINRFGKKGKGPNEILFQSSIEIDKLKNTFQFLTLNTYWFYEYSLDDLVNNTEPIPEKKFELDLGENSRLLSWSFLHGINKFAGTGLFTNGKYGIFNSNGTLEKTIGEYNISEEHSSYGNYNLGLGYQGPVKVHPNGNKFAHLTYACDLVEVVNFNEDYTYDIKRFQTWFPVFSESGAYSRDSPRGFSCSAVTSDYIYGLYSGHTFTEKGASASLGRLIYVFDWNLNPVASYELDHDVMVFAVSENNKKMYAFSLTTDKVKLVKWNLNH